MAPTLTEIRRYPVKSCAGHPVASAVVEPWGLAGDRRWMVVDDDGVPITARDVNRMVLVHPEPTATGLRLTAPDLPTLEVAVPNPALQVPVEVWGSELTAASVGAEADAWFAKVVGQPARLVHLDDPRRRTTDPRFSEPGDRVSFADGYPLLLATEDSLAALNDEILVASYAEREQLPISRFRPSVVVAGFEPWAEDDWRRVRIGDAVFRAVKGCDRCVMTTIDPDTGLREKEPVATLARIRRWDGKTWFGVNLVPDNPGVTIRVGDDVEVLEAVPPGDGPVR